MKENFIENQITKSAVAAFISDNKGESRAIPEASLIQCLKWHLLANEKELMERFGEFLKSDFPDDRLEELNQLIQDLHAEGKSLTDVIQDKSISIEELMDQDLRQMVVGEHALKKIVTIMNYLPKYQWFQKHYMQIPRGRVEFEEWEQKTATAFKEANVPGRFKWNVSKTKK